MLAIRSLFRTAPQVPKNAVQLRNMSGICIPPRKRVSKGELIVLGSIMVASWCAIPTWVLVNIKHYHSKE